MAHIDDGQLNALLDGELDQADKAEVQAHLGSCRICQGRLEEARAFLVESGELLEMLGGTGALGHGGTGRQKRPSQTVREKAIELALPGKTAQEPALNIDGRTAKTVASPFFPQAADRIAAQAAREADAQEGVLPIVAKSPRRFGDVSQLAWAASLVLAIGVGFLANEVRNLRRAESARAAAPTEMAVADSAATALAAGPNELDQSLSRQRAGAGSASGGAAQPRRPLVKPPDALGDKPPDATKGEPVFSRDPRSARADELAGVTTGAPQGNAGPGVRAPADAVTPAPLAENRAQRSEDSGRTRTPAAPAPTAAAPSRVAPGAAAPPAAAPLGAASNLAARRALAQPAPPTPAAFRRISADSAIRTLSGSIRLVDGLRHQRIEIGRGFLVPGADPDRDVVRVHYVDSLGRRLVLDQQPGDSRFLDGQTSGVNGLMRGDTLITSAGDSGVRVRWVDRKNFWLSLTAPLTPDEIRAVVERIR